MGQGHGEEPLPWERRRGGDDPGGGGGWVAEGPLLPAPSMGFGAVQWVPVRAIAVGTFRLRGAITAQEIDTLAQSIARQGLLSPLLGRSRDRGGGYDLIAGERRLRALERLGWSEVPLRVLAVSVAAAWEVALIENLQRQDLDVLEETEAILSLLAVRLDMEVEAVPRLLQRLAKGEQRRSRSATGQAIPAEQPEQMALIQETFGALGAGQWRSFVRNRLPVLQLPPPLLTILRQKQLPYTKVLAIAQVRDEGVRAQLLELVLSQGWSLRQIRQWVRQRSAAGSGDWGRWRSRLGRLQQGLQNLEGRSRSLALEPDDRDRVERLLTELEQVLRIEAP
ncbi:MAG: ParB/RepB/Spo0J family partition protein [Cyanobacteria bacterium]|nr:ParB/RepB/Spo0J family partition protein [Cyanobacteriota bacterium]